MRRLTTRTSASRATAVAALPLHAQLGEEGVARRVLLGHDVQAVRPVVADSGRVDQHRDTQPGAFRGEQPGRVHPGRHQQVFVVLRPPVILDAGAAEVDHRVGTVEHRAVDVTGVRVPQHLVRAAGLGPDQPGHLVTGLGQRRW